MTTFLEQAAVRVEAEKQSHIRPHVRELIASGERISWDQYIAFIETHGMNSWEREECVPLFDDDCLVKNIEYCLSHCEQKHRPGPCVTYDESLIHKWMPEILKRFQNTISGV